MLDTLKNTAEFLGSVRGRRKALLFFSEGLDYPIRDVFGAHDATTVIRATQDAISTAARANVNFYAIDPRGLSGMTTEFMEGAGIANGAGSSGPVILVPGTNTPSSGVTGGVGIFNVQDELMQEFRTSQDTLRELTEQTGGFASLNTNNVDPRIRTYRRREQPLLRARLLSAEPSPQRPVPQDRGKGQAPGRARRSATRVRRRRGAAPLKNGNATKPHGWHEKRGGRMAAARRRRCSV